MKILHTVEFYHPSVGGMQEVVKQLSERLAGLGHSVTVATARLPERSTQTVNGVKIAEFTVSGNLAQGFSGDIGPYRDFLLRSDFDIITNFAAQQWATDVMISMLDRIKAKKVFVPTGFSGLRDPAYSRYFDQMGNWMKQYDMNIFLSETYQDIAFARQKGVTNLTVIPNGASEEEFLRESGIDIRKQLMIPADHFLVLLVGSHTGLKGHAEAMEIFRRAEMTNAALLIIANDSSRICSSLCKGKKHVFNLLPGRKHDRKKILVAPLTRQETVAAYKTADLFLFPSNIECSPLVLFECMASKTPFLTTDVGNAAEIIAWSNAGILLPTRKDTKGLSHADIDGSARLLRQVYQNVQGRHQMKKSGYEAWSTRFTWGSIAKQYERQYCNLLKE